MVFLNPRMILLLVAVALGTAGVGITGTPGWALLGAGLVVLGEWVALEVLSRTRRPPRHGDHAPPLHWPRDGKDR